MTFQQWHYTRPASLGLLKSHGISMKPISKQILIHRLALLTINLLIGILMNSIRVLFPQWKASRI